MKLLVDENISPKLVTMVADLFPGSVHVRAGGLARAPDTDVWRFAMENGFVIVSKDEDFRHLSFLRGAPPKVIGLGIGNCTTQVIAQLLRDASPQIAAFVADPAASFLALP